MENRLRVLLVDEDADVAALTREFLEREDGALDVGSTTDPGDALDRVEAESFDVVVSDYEMPGMNGVALATELREHTPDLPVVLYTARDRSAFEAELGDALSGHVRKRTGIDQYADLVSAIRDVA